MRPLPIDTLMTPATLYAVTQTGTAYGGWTQTLSTTGTIWGDFHPDAPVMRTATGEGADGAAGQDAYIVQTAVFICRSADGIVRGATLNLKGFDWTILSLDEAADGSVRLRLERVHP